MCDNTNTGTRKYDEILIAVQAKIPVVQIPRVG